MKDKTYLFVSILALIVGLCFILFGKADIFSIGITVMGFIGTFAGMFLLMNPEEKDDKKDKKETLTTKTQAVATNPHICDHVHCSENAIRPKIIDNKTTCKYCKCKFAKNLDKCPYCGAPQNN